MVGVKSEDRGTRQEGGGRRPLWERMHQDAPAGYVTRWRRRRGAPRPDAAPGATARDGAGPSLQIRPYARSLHRSRMNGTAHDELLWSPSIRRKTRRKERNQLWTGDLLYMGELLTRAQDAR
ncbi:hypothetical protein PsYK624_101830 [Phanerochaete sordida]|uniref:Uncharacterized protein n=1 Tax=Phanerochaete sordida TaxID=48140 RepID=A0A9P3LG72_9APHY|nr:hypothetical protein PsYK624_101830 [Phanerochaete sordida]